MGVGTLYPSLSLNELRFPFMELLKKYDAKSTMGQAKKRKKSTMDDGNLYIQHYLYKNVTFGAHSSLFFCINRLPSLADLLSHNRERTPGRHGHSSYFRGTRRKAIFEPKSLFYFHRSTNSICVVQPPWKKNG